MKRIKLAAVILSASILSLAGCTVSTSTDNPGSVTSGSANDTTTTAQSKPDESSDSANNQTGAEQSTAASDNAPQTTVGTEAPEESTPPAAAPEDIDWSAIPEIDEKDLQYVIHKAGKVNFDNIPPEERDKLEDGCVAIKKYTGDAEYIKIPQTIAGYSNIAVVDVNWGKNAKAIKFPDGISFAVYNSGCGSAANATAIFLPDTVEYIQGFSGLKSIEELTLPASLKAVGKTTFFKLDKLKTVTLGENIKEINVSAFSSCANLEAVNFPSTLANGECVIYSNAFAGCTALKSIVLPEGVKFSGRSQFKDCTALESVTLPDSLTELGEDMFSGCGNVKITYKGSVYDKNSIYEQF